MPEYPPSALPADVGDLSEPTQCKRPLCRASIQWGKTTTGRTAPFDAEPPHPNHWITCADPPEKKR